MKTHHVSEIALTLKSVSHLQPRLPAGKHLLSNYKSTQASPDHRAGAFMGATNGALIMLC